VKRRSNRPRRVVTEATQAFSFSRRAWLLGTAQSGVGLMLAGRMAWLSVAENQHFTELSESNRVNMTLVPPRRGWIVDRNGVPIANNRTSFRVDVIPDRLEDEERVIAELGRILDLTPEELARIAADLKNAAGFQPVQIADKLDWERFAAVNVRLPELPGVAPTQTFARNYPSGAAVAHLTGYVGAPTADQFRATKDPLYVVPGFKLGKDGLEKTLETGLRGTPGARRVEVTARGKLIETLATRPGVPGHNERLTIDAGLQEYAARRLGDQSGSIVVLDCQNGDVLAMASMPAYDPNSFSDGISHNEWSMMADDEKHPLINKALQGLYPSGSTIKPLMALAFLQAGISPTERVTCTGAYRVGNAIFHCDKHHGTLDMHGAIEHSCDIYFYHTSLQAGVGVIAPMAKRMGFGEKFPLPVASQRYGTVPDPEWMQRRYKRKWELYDTINMSIGQGNILVNPLQLAVMAARIASGRNIMPRLLMRDPSVPAQPLNVTPEHLAFVRDAMTGVVNGGGTAAAAKLPLDGIQMAGKTGTAQVRRITMAERNSGGVRSNESLQWRMRDHSLFVGFAPADNPRYACSIIAEHGGFGAAVAAPACRDTLLYLFDRDKAMKALLPLEEKWGGDIATRMAKRTAEYKATQAANAAAEATKTDAEVPSTSAAVKTVADQADAQAAAQATAGPGNTVAEEPTAERD
jgi:penicillin-binding protein 2